MEPHHDRVRAAIRAAFGSVPVDAVTPIAGGASGAFPFRVEARGRAYVVRVEGPASPLRNPHQYKSMRIAAEAGIAPRLYYVDEEARVAVMDFIVERPWSAFPGGAPGWAQAIGALLRRLQGTTPFPRFVDYPDIVGRLWAWVCSTGLFASGVLDPVTERLQRLGDGYLWDPAHSVSSHNDLVPRNVLFDGTRLWLIDWESAYRNDPLVDVAIALDQFAPLPEGESRLLGAWLGHAPDAATSARLVLVRAFTRLYYAGVLLSASAAASGAVGDRDLSAPTMAEFHRAIRAGSLSSGTAAFKHVLGKMYLAAFMTGMSPPDLGG
jgi:aminoglycoside phosphotransferase (APT) family kinase protein